MAVDDALSMWSSSRCDRIERESLLCVDEPWERMQVADGGGCTCRHLKSCGNSEDSRSPKSTINQH